MINPSQMMKGLKGVMEAPLTFVWLQRITIIISVLQQPHRFMTFNQQVNHPASLKLAISEVFVNLVNLRSNHQGFKVFKVKPTNPFFTAIHFFQAKVKSKRFFYLKHLFWESFVSFEKAFWLSWVYKSVFSDNVDKFKPQVTTRG